MTTADKYEGLEDILPAGYPMPADVIAGRTWRKPLALEALEQLPSRIEGDR